MSERIIKPVEMTLEAFKCDIFEYYMAQVDEGAMDRETAFEVIEYEFKELDDGGI